MGDACPLSTIRRVCMATIQEVLDLRLLVDISSEDPPYTDEYLGTLIDTYGIDTAGSIIWRQKAASYASFVDMTESGSSRKLSQLRQAALEMANGLSPVEESVSGGSFVVPIERA
jgi:hypothetical protein